ncbi:Endoribonuclease L-PSP [Pirellula sp. SH-Sr6A]|uniref:Rid family hydrolase n=1 Tax=Pirellula sp. SH-Sr6A TaxID=1632865 RepID=UPI00078E1273|nr:Rid family hydrolase [Pirellula sp. SH-Sr6A]AMV33924.1 Endoribonuclease L-PSP [Pirellula sp. SH-Sr6A]
MPEIKRFGVTRRWSDAVVFQNTAYFVEVPDDATLSPGEQFAMLFQQVESRCTALGTSIRNLMQVLIYLPYPEDLPEFNRLWDEWIPAGCAPVRACCHPALADKGYRAELIITAMIPDLTAS